MQQTHTSHFARRDCDDCAALNPLNLSSELKNKPLLPKIQLSVTLRTVETLLEVRSIFQRIPKNFKLSFKKTFISQYAVCDMLFSLLQYYSVSVGNKYFLQSLIPGH